ncbi:SCO family protein [Sedimentitalea arenosa]|jgi:protein SCO1/2|uniref:SCO family protein n=1 Tax=Sedimentitalea arenosa TaxID=2798803 RepID=A0A8J7IQX9_9RHOB|nr:SCO family protein [Arenibacterium arenosum]MBJ6372001.1 SCO family protein [Arenibacterium arenosum]
MSRLYALVAAAVLVALGGGLWLATSLTTPEDQFAQCRASQVAGGTSQIGGPFELVNADGETVTDKDVLTEPALIYFGYTFCPDVCPLDTARNAEVVDLLDARGKRITPVFISIDPQRDTPKVVGDFAANLHERMIGLTGSPEQVKAASQAYKTYYKAQPADDEYYLVDHSTFSYLVLPEHGFVEFFRRDTPPEEMADQIACFLDNA